MKFEGEKSWAEFCSCFSERQVGESSAHGPVQQLISQLQRYVSPDVSMSSLVECVGVNALACLSQAVIAKAARENPTIAPSL